MPRTKSTNPLVVSPKFMTYLENSKLTIAKHLIAHFNDLPFPEEVNTADMITTDFINYLDIRTDGSISYCPSNKNVPDTDVWKIKNRQAGKPAKVIRKLFTATGLQRFKNTDFEAFSNECTAQNSDGFTLSVISGKAIIDTYNTKDYVAESSLGNSCMRGNGRYLDMYNQDKVRMLVCHNQEGKLVGRALVWSIDEMEYKFRPDGGYGWEKKKEVNITYMDRIYSSRDSVAVRMLSFAEEQGWWTRVKYTSMDYKMFWKSPEGDTFEYCAAKVNLNTDHFMYPYMDTMTYGGDGFISNKETEYTDVRFECTDGRKYVKDDCGDFYTWNGGKQADEVHKRWVNTSVYMVRISQHAELFPGLCTVASDCVSVQGEGHFLKHDPNIAKPEGEKSYWLKKDLLELNGKFYLAGTDAHLAAEKGMTIEQFRTEKKRLNMIKINERKAAEKQRRKDWEEKLYRDMNDYHVYSGDLFEMTKAALLRLSENEYWIEMNDNQRYAAELIDLMNLGSTLNKPWVFFVERICRNRRICNKAAAVLYYGQKAAQNGLRPVITSNSFGDVIAEFKIRDPHSFSGQTTHRMSIEIMLADEWFRDADATASNVLIHGGGSPFPSFDDMVDEMQRPELPTYRS